MTHDLADAEKAFPKDGSVMHGIGEVVSEQVDIAPMRIQVLRHLRHPYGCWLYGETAQTAIFPVQPIPQDISSPVTLYNQDSRNPINSNLVENAIGPLFLGRQIWLVSEPEKARSPRQDS